LGGKKVQLRQLVENGAVVASTEAKERLVVIVGILFIVALTLVSLQLWGSSMSFPRDVGEPIAREIDDATDWLTREGDFIFSRISDYIRQVLAWTKEGLLWLPWPTVIALVGLIAWRVADPRVALFSMVSLLAIGFADLWESSMETMALIFTSVMISIAFAVPLGLIASRSDMVDTVTRPLLDGMQTMPSFVYLVPAVFFFSPGTVPAVLATVIYAMPPAIRLTNLGIRQVSAETVEAARAFGATSLQLLFKVQVPLALPTIMAGINQTIMMALAMAVIASLVGAGGLGEDVLRALGRLEVGNSLLAGLAIVILAIIIDRTTQGFAKERAQATQE
jgi:glycine betaine/proline transport system permease protein